MCEQVLSQSLADLLEAMSPAILQQVSPGLSCLTSPMPEAAVLTGLYVAALAACLYPKTCFMHIASALMKAGQSL